MKTVYLNRDYYYQPHRKISVVFKGGYTYCNVLDKAAAAIIKAGAGEVVEPLSPSFDYETQIDAKRAWRPRFGNRAPR